MKIFATIKDKCFTFEEKQLNGTDADSEKSYSLLPLTQNRFSLVYNNKSHLVHIIRQNDLYHVHIDGDYFAVDVEEERTRQIKELLKDSGAVSGTQKISAPIPGLITKIRVSEGDTIQQGDALIILEAMKMENEIRAENGGKIIKILVEEGEVYFYVRDLNKFQQLILE